MKLVRWMGLSWSRCVLSWLGRPLSIWLVSPAMRSPSISCSPLQAYLSDPSARIFSPWVLRLLRARRTLNAILQDPAMNKEGIWLVIYFKKKNYFKLIQLNRYNMAKKIHWCQFIEKMLQKKNLQKCGTHSENVNVMPSETVRIRLKIDNKRVAKIYRSTQCLGSAQRSRHVYSVQEYGLVLGMWSLAARRIIRINASILANIKFKKILFF